VVRPLVQLRDGLTSPLPPLHRHPDNVKDASDKPQAEAKMQVVLTAFKVLSDPWEREMYVRFGLKKYLYHVKVLQSFKNYLFNGVRGLVVPRGARCSPEMLLPCRRWAWSSTPTAMAFRASA
jgi:hypothetical protein